MTKLQATEKDTEVGTTVGIKQLARRFIGSSVDRPSKHHKDTIEAINALEPHLRQASESQLRIEADILMERARTGISLDDMCVTVFALVREVARREIGLRPFDVQVMGGLGLHEGEIVQMDTGEKTLAAVSPVVLHALGRRGVHVLTFNDYLARRDAEWMGPIYRFLGLTVEFIEGSMGLVERRNAYQADVTYLTAKDAGFDFLRDGLAFEACNALLTRPS